MPFQNKTDVSRFQYFLERKHPGFRILITKFFYDHDRFFRLPCLVSVLASKENIGMIAAGVAAAIVIAVVAIQFGSSVPSQQITESTPEIANTTSKMQGPVFQQMSDAAETYKINTECELIYGIAYGAYPDGEKLPGVKIDNLLANYPEEFKPWKETLQNTDNRTEFFKKPLTDEFRGVLTTALMKETSINPKLEQIAMIVTDGQGKAKLQQAFQEFQCQKYFDERQKK